MQRIRIAVEWLRNAFWALPALAIALAIGAALALPPLDASVTLPDRVSFSGGPDTGRAVLQAIATVAVSVAGISFSVIVVALVLASQQLSPRVLRSFQRHPLNQTVLGLFLATAAFSLFVLAGFEESDRVPELAVTVAMLLAALSLGLFVVFLHHVVRSLNASAIIRRIAADGHQAVHRPYPRDLGAAPEDEREAERTARELVARGSARAVRAPRAGYVVSVEVDKAIRAARSCDGFVEQRRAIGDFTVTGGILGVVWCEDEDRVDELADRVCGAFVLNEERIVDDDIAFPLRQLTDVALKGLSPGINDPTTAENAMDSVTDTLVRLAQQPQPAMLRLDGDGTPRFRALAPSLDALVRLGFDQVRRDGSSRPSFAVRLLELLAELRAVGGERARACDEIDRQARAVRDQAVKLADVRTDADFVDGAYERLHAPSGDGRYTRETVAPAAAHGQAARS